MHKTVRFTICILAIFTGLASLVWAEDDKPTNEEIAKELANPNTALTSLKFQFQSFKFDGDLPRAKDQNMFKLFFQPVLPFPLENEKTVWVRPGVPIVSDQPIFDVSTRRIGTEDGLGDISLDVQYGEILDDGFLWSVGASSLFPTASKERIGSEYWTLGPGFQLGYVLDKSIYAVFVNHQWDIGGNGRSSPDLPYFRQTSSNDPGVSLTAIQPFIIFLPGEGWSVGTAPIITHNHKTQQWIVPLNLVIGKTVTINGRPWDFSVDINYYVERPDAIGPEWMISFNVAPVIKNIFADWFKG